MAVFGCGNLMDVKLAPAIVRVLSEMHPDEAEQVRFLIGDHIPRPDFGTHIEHSLRESAPKSLTLTGWPRFRKTRCYHNIPDTTGEKAFFDEVRRFLDSTDGKVVFYLALPYKQNPVALERMARYLAETKMGHRMWVVTEKPLVIDDMELKRVERALKALGVTAARFGIVEHFGAKPFFREAVNPESDLGLLLRKVVLRKPRSWEIQIMEMVGTAGRDFPGVGVDSMLNHHAYCKAVLGSYLFGKWGGLTNPHDRAVTFAETLCHIAGQARNIKGQYLICRQDHGGSLPSGEPQHIPTCLHLNYDLVLPDGDTLRMVSNHAKNTDKKTTLSRLQGDDWVLELQMEGDRAGDRFYGWKFWENGELTVDQVFDVSRDRACGYPSVVRWMLEGDMHEFMSTNFQRCSNGFYMPILGQLDRSNQDERRIWFDRGDNPLLQIHEKPLVDIEMP